MAKDSLNDLANANNPNCEIVPRIYVACLAAYNEGILHGQWLDETQKVEVIYEQIHKMLSESPMVGAGEFAIHDSDGFGSLSLGKYETIDTAHEKAMVFLEHGELGVALLLHHGNVLFVQDVIENHYHGCYESELEFAIQLFEELYMGKIPEAVQGYIDYASYKRDLFIGDFFSIEVRGKTHVFTGH